MNLVFLSVVSTKELYHSGTKDGKEIKMLPWVLNSLVNEKAMF